MSTESRLSGRLVAAARALVGIGSDVLAQASGLARDEVEAIEAAGAAWASDAASDRLRAALETYGAIILPEADGLGAGVRLKFTRADARQIARLEGEGGPIRSDDVP